MKFIIKFFKYISHDIGEFVNRLKGRVKVVERTVELEPKTEKEELYVREILGLKAEIAELKKELEKHTALKRKEFIKKIKEAINKIKEERKLNKPISIKEFARLLAWLPIRRIYVKDINDVIIGILQDIKFDEGGVEFIVKVGKETHIIRFSDLYEAIVNFENLYNQIKHRYIRLSGTWDGKVFRKVPWFKINTLLYDETGKTTIDYLAQLLQEYKILQNRYLEAKKEAELLKIKNATLESSVTSLQQVIEDITSTNATLINKIYHEFLPKVQIMSVSYADLLYQLSIGRTVIDNMRKEIERLKSEMSSAEVKSSLVTLISKLEARVADLENLLSDLVKSISPHLPKR